MLLGGINKVFKIPRKFQEAFVSEYFFSLLQKRMFLVLNFLNISESP